MLCLVLEHSVTANQGSLLLTFHGQPRKWFLLHTGNTTLVGAFLDMNHHSTVLSASLRIHCSCRHHLHAKRGCCLCGQVWTVKPQRVVWSADPVCRLLTWLVLAPSASFMNCVYFWAGFQVTTTTANWSSMMRNSGCTSFRRWSRCLDLPRYSCTYLSGSNKEILLATRTGQCEQTLQIFVGQTLQQLFPLPRVQSSVCDLRPACAAPQCMRWRMHIRNFDFDAGIDGLLFIDVAGHLRNDTLQLSIVVFSSHSISESAPIVTCVRIQLGANTF